MRDLKTQTRRLFNRAKMTGKWGPSKESLTRYNREIRKAKRSSWRRYCQGIKDVPGSSRLKRTEDHGETGEQQGELGEAT
jgi:hypothetical protein